ncbi:hypothetical protein AAG906_019394 [Vitis piasezkii]
MYSQDIQHPKLSTAAIGHGLEEFGWQKLEHKADLSIKRRHLGTRNNGYGHAEGLYGDEFETNLVAAASAAAMKEAMDRAEAKYRHAKGIRERNNARCSGESNQRKTERLEHERQEREREEEERNKGDLREQGNCKEREEKEREQRRLEKERERSREIERKGKRPDKLWKGLLRKHVKERLLKLT